MSVEEFPQLAVFARGGAAETGVFEYLYSCVWRGITTVLKMMYGRYLKARARGVPAIQSEHNKEDRAGQRYSTPNRSAISS